MPKAQSTLEYITTYAWAIAVIVIALAALYALGVFNFNNITAKAQPGACQVYRPYGPESTQLISLQGVCTNIQPKSVASFSSGSSVVNIANSMSVSPTGEITIAAWVYAPDTTPATQYVVSKMSGTAGYAFPVTTNGWSSVTFDIYSGGSLSSVTANYPTTGIFHFLAATYNGNTMSIYIDGSLAATASHAGSISVSSNNLTIGTGGEFGGYVSNLQIYNSSLNSNQIYLLYEDGIGAEPQVLQNITGWWPLNSDLNDYSGNGDNGASNSVSFTSVWTNYYAH